MLDSGLGSGIGTVHPTLIDTSRCFCIFSVKRFDSMVVLYLCAAFFRCDEDPQDVRAELPFTLKSQQNKHDVNDVIIFDINCIYLNLLLTLSLSWPRTQVAKSFWLAEANVMAIAVKLYGPLPSRHFSHCQDSHE